MRTLSAFIAISSLLLGIASIATLIGAVLALFVFFPLSLLGLGGVLAGADGQVKCASTTPR